MTLCVLLGACGPKLVGDLPADEANETTVEAATDGASTTGGPVTASGQIEEIGSGETTGGESSGFATTAGETTGGPDDATGDTGSGDSTGPGIALECMGLDHETCYSPVVDICGAQGNWNVAPACVEAVGQCYPLGPAALGPADVIQLCSAEMDSSCLFNNEPGCGATFCNCMAGQYPFDWTNCWHLTLVACKYGPHSDCGAVLATCYPGTTVAEYDACFEQVYQDLGNGCDCPMCGIHEQCDDALVACLAG